MDFSYSQQQLEIKRGIREWGKKHLTEEAIAAGYKNRGIAPEIAKAWVDDGWGMYGLPEEYGGKPVDHQTMAMIIEELNHCGGNIPMAPNLLIMFDMVEFGTPEQIQYAVDYYKENGYPPYCLAISEPEAGSANQYMTTTATKKDGKIINFLGKKNICFILSIVIIVAGWAGMALHKGQTGYILNYGMDFTGGTSTNVTFNEDMSLDDISAKVVPVVSKITGDADVQTQKVAGTNEVIIKTKTLDVEQRQQLEDAMVENFGVDAEKITAESISGAVSTEMKKDAVWAVTIATVLMLLYIWFRFKDIRFAASAILALVHDVLVVITFYSLAKWSVGSTFIACMLTIVGYSINATIVIFDRIRENLALKKAGSKQTLEEVVNLSITQTFTRSINTSLTTFIMVFVLFLLGVSSIREFALPLMVGIVCGTYSSVCVTGALWYVLTTRKQKKAEK